MADDPHNISTALAVALREGLAAGDRGAVAEAGEALTHGYTTGFLVGAGMLLVAAVVAIDCVSVDADHNNGAALRGSPRGSEVTVSTPLITWHMQHLQKGEDK